MSKTILLGSAVALGVFAFLFLISPALTGFGPSTMMGGRYFSQNWGPRGCPVINNYDRGNGSSGWEMIENWR